MKNTIPNFKGKVVSVVLRDKSWTRAIQDPRFEVQCDRLFLVGVSPLDSSSKDWITGLRYAVAWDCIMDYAVFDSVQDYQRRLKKYYGKNRRSA